MRLIDDILEKLPFDVVTDVELTAICEGTPNARHARVKRALAKGEIIRIKRGLYVVGPRYQRQKLSKFVIAQLIYPPSCVSLESALSHHGFIPEAVYSTTSVTPRRAAEFNTPNGTFTYTQVPAKVCLLQAERLTEGKQAFFMASPLRAICDHIHTKQLEWTGVEPLIYDMRIDESDLSSITKEQIDELMVYPSKRVQKFLEGLRAGLRL